MACPRIHQEGCLPPSCHAAAGWIRGTRLESAPPARMANGRVAIGGDAALRSSLLEAFTAAVTPASPIVGDECEVCPSGDADRRRSDASPGWLRAAPCEVIESSR